MNVRPLPLLASSPPRLRCRLASCRSARAEKADREKPINYSADTGDVNYQTKVGALSGNVVITQGTLSIRADRIDVPAEPRQLDIGRPRTAIR